MVNTLVSQSERSVTQIQKNKVDGYGYQFGILLIRGILQSTEEEEQYQYLKHQSN